MIVDDSSVARAVLSRMVAADPGFEVVALAGSAGEALDGLRTIDVDIVLLDVEMPGTSGIQVLPEIIAAGKGARVLIVSSMAEDGAEITVRALALGAADTLPKPGVGTFGGRFSEVLVDRLRRIGRATRPNKAPAGFPGSISLRAMPNDPVECIALGASTGGLHALIEFLCALPARVGVPILITQHLPPVFMSHFARQLENACGRTACVASDGQALADDRIHIAPGDAHLCLERVGESIRISLDRERVASNCLPSVDPMLASAAAVYGAGAIGIILSGMGRDGLIGSRALVEQGGAILAQDPHSSAIWGMPRAVAEAGLVSALLPPREIARRLVQRLELHKWK